MKPNFLIFVVDEQRYPPIYESEELREWRKKNLLFEQELMNNGIVFHNHYTNTNACCPARTTFHTGVYPNTHGVSQTDGIAKSATDPEMTWLPKFTVPTIGNYFKEIGYKTYLKGKWHVSDAGIKLNNGEYFLTFDEDGNRLLDREEIYLEKNVLEDYGYDGWIGPEPHGSLPQNSGSSVPPPERGRDVGYSEQVIEELKRLRCSKDPWLMMASFVNPHDIATYGLYSNFSSVWDYPVDKTLPEKLFTEEFYKSLNDPLITKPAAQRISQSLYASTLQPIIDLDKYQRVYYTLQKEVSNDMMKVWKRFKKSKDYENTIVLFFSDHGDYLSSHGNMHQKWFAAYQEAIHIPFIISSPLLNNKCRNIYEFTSHIDLLPTLLGFAGLNSEKQNEVRRKLGPRFSLNVSLPGLDLSPWIFDCQKKLPNRPVYFNTQDNPTKGQNQINFFGQPYPAVPEPCAVEAILYKYHGNFWKLTQYYDPESNSKTIGITHELYNITEDSIELHNLYDRPKYEKIQKRLSEILSQYSFLNK